MRRPCPRLLSYFLLLLGGATVLQTTSCDVTSIAYSAGVSVLESVLQSLLDSTSTSA